MPAQEGVIVIPDFGRLERVPPREVWPHEAADFTPWLAENISALGDVLGMDLEFRGREAPVGNMSLDLLAHDLGRDRPVIIENQFGQTDPDHLGKLLTYAAGYDAGVIVWIAEHLKEEHRQAIDWLNQRTDEDTEFYGVVIEVLKIDGSRPAYNFKPVAFPNDWRRKKKASGGATPASERGEAYRVFFQDLIDELREQHHFTGARKGRPLNWYSFASGMRGIVYAASFAQGGRVRAEVYVDLGKAGINKEKIFDELAKEKAKFEAAFGEALSWERLDERRACRVATYRPGNIDETHEELKEIKEWVIDRLLKLKKVLGGRLSQLVDAALG